MASGYALFDGTTGSEIVTPDHPSLDVTVALDIRALVAPELWDPLTDETVVAKWFDPDEDAAKSYRVWVAINRLHLMWRDSDDVDVQSEPLWSVAVDGEPLWVRVTVDATASRFYTSPDPLDTEPAQVNWVQLGSDEIGAAAGINSGDSPVALGSFDIGEEHLFSGKLYYVEIRNDDVIVANPDFRDADQKTGDSPTTFTDTTGKVWTFNTAVWVPPNGGGGGAGGRRKIRGPRNPRRYQV